MYPGLAAALFQSLPNAHILLDASGLIVGANAAAERLLGCRATDIAGLTLEPVVPPALLTDARVTDLVGEDGQSVGAAVRLGHDAEANLDRTARLAALRFRGLFTTDVLGICCGENDRITEANDQFLLTIGAAPEDLQHGLALGGVFVSSSPRADPFVDGVTREYELRRLDGTTAHVLAAGVSLGAGGGWVGVAFDVTERKLAENAIAHLALHDPVTGLPNRRLLINRIEHALSRAVREARIVAVLFCDVDKFKPINDRYGHRAGDLVLQGVARRLQSVLRDGDTVARVGGDEFVILLEDLSDPTEATRIAERARIAVGQPITLDEGDVTVSTSIGVAISRGPAEQVDALLRRADDGMYAAKERGRDQIAFAEEEIAGLEYPTATATQDPVESPH